jgi:putative lipoic acid-binding regulatory protein
MSSERESPLESPLEFPSDIPVKVFGRNHPKFRLAVVEIVEGQYGAAYSIAEQQSKQGSYASLTITVRAESREQIDALYRALVAHELVILVL